VAIIFPSLTKLEKIALGMTMGLGFITQELFLLSVLNINYSKTSVLLPIIFIDIFLVFLFCHNTNFDKKRLFVYIFSLPIRIIREAKSLNFFEIFLLGPLIFLVLAAFTKAVFWPVYYWDALALYDYRAKIFFEAGGIASSMALASLPFHGAPPMTSLAHAFIYILGGENANPQFIYALFYLALLVTFYASVRIFCKRWVSLLFTFLLASIPFFVEFAANAYTNLPYAFYFGMGTVYLCRFFKEEKTGHLLLSGTLLGLAGWTRSPTEQFILATVMVLSLWCFWRKKYYWAPLFLIFSFIIFVIPWKFYTAYALNTPFMSPEIISAVNAGMNSPIDIKRFINVTALLFQSIKGVSGTSLVLAFLALIFFPKMLKENVFLLMLLLAHLSLLVFGSYAFSLSWPDWQDSITNSAHRLSMILPPIALYCCAICTPFFPREGEGKK